MDPTAGRRLLEQAAASSANSAAGQVGDAAPITAAKAAAAAAKAAAANKAAIKKEIMANEKEKLAQQKEAEKNTPRGQAKIWLNGVSNYISQVKEAQDAASPAESMDAGVKEGFDTSFEAQIADLQSLRTSLETEGDMAKLASELNNAKEKVKNMKSTLKAFWILKKQTECSRAPRTLQCIYVAWNLLSEFSV